VIGAAAVVSLAVMLFAGAGNAQAETNPTYFANQDGSLEVIYGADGVALYATIVDAHNPPGATDVCQQLGGTYSVNVTCYGTGNSAAYSRVVY
jgi:hypothetical protein